MLYPKVLGFRALYFACGIFFIFFIHNYSNVIFHFLAAARKIARLPEKNYFARLWWLQLPTAPQLIRLWQLLYNTAELMHPAAGLVVTCSSTRNVQF